MTDRKFSVELGGTQLVNMVRLNVWAMGKLVNEIKFTKARPNQNAKSREALSRLVDETARCKDLTDAVLPLALGHLLATEKDHVAAASLKLAAQIAADEAEMVVTGLLLNALQLGE